jgi:hypothetical protein
MTQKEKARCAKLMREDFSNNELYHVEDAITKMIREEAVKMAVRFISQCSLNVMDSKNGGVIFGLSHPDETVMEWRLSQVENLCEESRTIEWPGASA